MGFFRKIFRKKKAETELEENLEQQPQDQEEELTQILIDRSQIDMDDEVLRKRYVTSCLEQIADATNQIKQLEEEYRSVNAYLQDMEVLDALPAREKRLIEEQAKAIDGLNADREKYKSKKLHLSEENFHKMTNLGEDAPDAIKKLKEAEEYQELIRQDLTKLEGEKQACLYRRHESRMGLENLRGMAIICSFAVFSCLAVLLILQFVFELEVKVGYILTAAAAAITLMVLYLKYQETEREMQLASGSLNKVILLQNKVKIRYVNNTNLLDYLYMKYNVSSAAQLNRQWDGYLKEKEVRERMERTEETLDYHEGELVRMLKEYHLFDPMIWIHQALALYNPKEMVEVRHKLILRRQKLRKQMEFNTTNANNAQEIIKDLVGDYPMYANEILKMVSDYEEREE